MTDLRDEDGTRLVRTRDGDLVPATDDGGPDPLPVFNERRRCEEHGEFGARARSCTFCWSEIVAGDRPRSRLGRRYVPVEGEPR